MSDRYPHVVESYRGTEIWYDPLKGKYYASHCEHTMRSESIKVVKKWLDDYKN